MRHTFLWNKKTDPEITAIYNKLRPIETDGGKLSGRFNSWLRKIARAAAKAETIPPSTDQQQIDETLQANLKKWI